MIDHYALCQKSLDKIRASVIERTYIDDHAQKSFVEITVNEFDSLMNTMSFLLDEVRRLKRNLPL